MQKDTKLKCSKSPSLAISQGMMVAVALVAGCPANPPETPEPVKLDPTLSWHGDNRQKIDELLANRGKTAPGFDTSKPPVAALDLDNTVLKNDIGDATFFYMVKASKIRQPPDKNWKKTSPFLTADAQAALNKACDEAAQPGQALPTADRAPCADELIAIYSTGKTTGDKAAFAGFNFRRMEPTYAWAAQLQAGYSAAESAAFAETALTEGLAAKEGTTQKLGTKEGLTAWLRIYDQSRDVATKLKEAGFDVWVVSASPQPWVEVVASKIGIAKNRVIGVRTLEKDGKLVYDLAGCGDVLDGKNEVIPYIDGKRCYINQEIYGVRGAEAYNQNRDRQKRPAFVAGDSDTDISMLRDATELRLVLNRNKKEILCHAYHNSDGKWLVNPMFIQPLKKAAQAYPCSTTACKDAAGISGPCKDDTDKVIPDQEDRIAAP